MLYLRGKLSSDRLKDRVLITSLLFLLVFFGMMVISYYLLPEGLLKNKNPLQNWEPSTNTFVLSLQIFFYNQLSVLVIVFASLFGQKKEQETNYLSLGYLVFFTQIFINGMVLGTWSFSIESDAVPLFSRFLRTFDVTNRAGLWEMTGQMLITCSVAHIATVLTNGKNTTVKESKTVP